MFYTVINKLINLLELTRKLFLSHLFSNFIEKQKKQIILHYFHNLQWHSVIIPIRRGPFEILRCTSEKDNEEIDITEKIQPFLLQMSYLTPKMLGYDSLKIYTMNDEKEFKNDETIII